MKECPKCGTEVGQGLVTFSSLRKKYCANCGTTTPWPLDKGQEPLVKHQR